MALIYLVEDDDGIGEIESFALKNAGHEVALLTSVSAFWKACKKKLPDLIVMDVMLPDADGFHIVKEIREKELYAKIPILMVSARDSELDIVRGLDCGADDYLTKPFHIDELVARVNAQLRMDNVQVQKNYVEAGDLRLNIKNTTLTCTTTNESIEVVCKEFMLLEYLMKNKNQVLQKEQLYEKIWGLDNESESNNLEAYLSFIRKKIKIIGSNVQIKAIRGIGYKLEVENWFYNFNCNKR